jgi:hypothetical protein
MVPDRGLSVDLRQPASFLAGVGAIATSPTLRTATDRTGAWRWRSSHHDVARSLEAINDPLGHNAENKERTESLPRVI